MHPDISEFSYGYALTETLISASPTPIRAAPIFPSLIEEGSPGGGYDVQIPFPGTPLFLQFKLSHCMVRDTAAEAQKGIFSTPYYRMHLRPTKHSQQHPMLLALEATGAAVFYAAPRFHTPSELNDAYTTRQVVHRSILIQPSRIGALPDDEDHYVAFKTGYAIYVCSDKPRQIADSTDNREFIEGLGKAFGNSSRLERNRDSVSDWADRLDDIVRDHRWYIEWITDQRLDALRDGGPLARFSYLARTFFGCNVVLVAPAEGEAGHAG
jgi:hypothetical protein